MENKLLILQGATLIDGTGREPLSQSVVVIQGEKIIFAGTAGKWKAPKGRRTVTLDLNGKFLLPGLIDCHVHLCGSGEPDANYKADDGTVALRMLRNARRNLAAGITTVRDVGGWNAIEFSVRRAIQAGQFTGPRMMLLGRYIGIPNDGEDHYTGMMRPTRGVKEMRRAVREQVKKGADQIKIATTGAVLVRKGEPGATRFHDDEIRAAVTEAARFGKRVAAHAHGIDGIRKAVQAGVHTIEHGSYLRDGGDVIAAMARRGTFLVPTLKVSWDLSRGKTTEVPAWMIKKTCEVRPIWLESVRAAWEGGVQIANGSDVAMPLNRHGENALEVYLLTQAGLPPMDALRAATAIAARALDWDAWLGTIERGKVADLLILDKNPLDDLRRLADPKLLQAVILGGRIVARQSHGIDVPGFTTDDCLTVGAKQDMEEIR